MIVDPRDLDRRERNALVNGLVAPRPVAWVSTVSLDGVGNLAPFSYFNAFSYSPPTLAIGPGSRDGTDKDTLRNIRETGEFVISLVSEELAERADRSSAALDSEIDEWDLLDLTPAASDDVRPPRVADSPAAFECRSSRILDLGLPELPSNALVVGIVTRIHVADAALDGLTPQPEALRLVGRLGGRRWCRTTDVFELR